MLKIVNQSNYLCKVVKIDILNKKEGLDNLLETIIDYTPVLVGKDTKIGDVVLYFRSGTRISDLILRENNLYSDSTLNKDTTKKAFVSKRKIIKAVKFRNHKSDGFCLPISDMRFLVDDLSLFTDNINQEFDYIDGIQICDKYVPVVRNSGLGKRQDKVVRISRLVDNQFRLMVDTDNLRREIHRISKEDYIGVTYKIHGTSGVCGNVLVKRYLKWYEKLLKRVGIKIVDTEYDYIFSSRRVIKNSYLNQSTQSFYDVDIWKIAKEELKDRIPFGYTLYFEIAGYLPNGKAIQPGYDYSCKENEYKIYIYRITYTNPDGYKAELSTPQIKQFCDQYGFNYSEILFFYGKAWDLFNQLNAKHQLVPVLRELDDRDWRGDFIKLLELEYNEKDCFLCVQKVPEEGVVIRKESLFDFEAMKLKSHKFLVKESEQLEKSDEPVLE